VGPASSPVQDTRDACPTFFLQQFLIRNDRPFDFSEVLDPIPLLLIGAIVLFMRLQSHKAVGKDGENAAIVGGKKTKKA
jgi:hypothetical protein